MKMKKLLSGITALAMSVSVFAGLTMTASAAETTVEQALSGHTAIIGTGVTLTCETVGYLNSYAANGGAFELYYTLDDSFDVSKVTKAELILKEVAIPTKNRTGTVSVYGLSDKTTFSDLTPVTYSNGAVNVYTYGSSSTKRYTYSGTPIATFSDSAYWKTNNSFDVTSYIKGLTSAQGGDTVIFGVSITDYAADTQIAAYGHETPSTLTITYSDETTYAVTFTGLPDDAVVTVGGTDVTDGTSLPAGDYTYAATAAGYQTATGTFTVTDADVSVEITMDRNPAVTSFVVNYTDESGNILDTATITDTLYVGESYTHYFPKYVNNNGTLYGTSAINGKEYHKTYELTSEVQTETITYSATDYTDIVYFAEAEDISVLTAVNSGAVPDRCSEGYGAYAASDATITTLAPGKYKVGFAHFGNSGITFTISAGDVTVASAGTLGYFAETVGEEFTLTENTDLVFAAAGNAGSSPKVVDYIFVCKTGEYVPPAAAYTAEVDKVDTYEGDDDSFAAAYITTITNTGDAEGTPESVTYTVNEKAQSPWSIGAPISLASGAQMKVGLVVSGLTALDQSVTVTAVAE